jgi:hypothetical protein
MMLKQVKTGLQNKNKMFITIQLKIFFSKIVSKTSFKTNVYLFCGKVSAFVILIN